MSLPGFVFKATVGLALWVMMTSSAHAHLVTTGLGPVYDGISHLLMTPEDLLPLLAISLFVGLRGPTASRTLLFLLPATWLMGGLFGLLFNLSINPSWAIVSVLLCGGLTAADSKIPDAGIAALAAFLGLFHGFLNGAALAEVGTGALGLYGIVASAFVFVALISSFAIPLKADWTRIAVRVLGSWVVAIGLLMLGWSFRL